MLRSTAAATTPLRPSPRMAASLLSLVESHANGKPHVHAVRRPHSTLEAHHPDEEEYDHAIDDFERKNGHKSSPRSSEPPRRPIYVAATRQHVGKTSCSLALVSGLQKRFGRVGFIKPVGQKCVPVHSDDLDQTIRVDKDVALIREHFGLRHIDYRHMSPVIIPRGYTKDFLDGKIRHEGQMDAIRGAYRQVEEVSDVMVCEGTGHSAVGSIVGAGNARVASWLGADMVLVANGGLGSAFDELELNRVLCEHHGVNVAGVIINKVLPEKYEQTKYYMGRALMQAWGIPLLGCIPDRPFLGCPALADLERLFETELMSGHRHRFRHFSVRDINLVTTSLRRFLENLRAKPSRTLYLCHVTRDDIILGFMGEYRRRLQSGEGPFEAALVVCGRKDKYNISREVRDMIGDLDDVPIMIATYSTHEAMERIHGYTPKLNIDDTNRLQRAVQHYEPHIDFDELLRRVARQDVEVLRT